VAFLPEDFVVPELVAGPRFRIRPVTVHDVVRLYDAVMSSRERLYVQFGEVSDWPAADLSLEQCLIDVAWQQKEGALRRSFGFAVLSTDEVRMLGSIRLVASRKDGIEADVTYWVRAGSEGLEPELDAFVREWVTTSWPFKSVGFPGRDIAWAEWALLPAR
jgi:Acetyltransferase (GNAT) domain